MRSALVVVAVGLGLVGCSFEPAGPGPGPGGGSPDASAPGAADAAASADAGVDAAPTWTVIETLMIDTASPTAVVSMTSLAAGRTYRLRASGVASAVIDGKPGDAEYWDFDPPRDAGCCEDIGLGVNDVLVDLDTRPDWGPYNPAHVYEVDWVGEGGPIAVLFQDTLYSNNTGVLTVELLDLR